ncbi:MAG: hypothetical protein F6K00_22820 [Leptolyngbya sp. SIOISBB]|nr:hypothetical protein [Leptolyngbya sp. SIOISBB]
MLDSEVFEKLQTASVAEKIQLIEAILQTLKQGLRKQTQPSVNHDRLLRGKLRCYDSPYEPIAAEDWEASALVLTSFRSQDDEQ